MKNLLAGTFALALTVLVGGCGNSIESVMEEGMRIREDVVDLAATLKDKAAVEAARPQLENYARRLADLAKKAKDIAAQDAKSGGGAVMPGFGNQNPKEAKKDQRAREKALLEKLRPRAEAAEKKMAAVPPDVRAAVDRIMRETMKAEMAK